MNRISLFFLLLLTPTVMSAQGPLEAVRAPLFDASLGYSYTQITSPNSFGLNGVDSGFTVNFLSRVGVRIDVGYSRASNVFGSGHHADVLSYLGGPVLYPSRSERLTTYVEGLAGAARVTGPIQTGPSTFLSGYANRLAWAAGGGAEFKVSANLRIREGADYLPTESFNQSSQLTGQNGIRAVCSLVVYLGRR